MEKLIKAAENMDWQQVVLHRGKPCFHLVENGTFCGRADRWIGHNKENHHIGHPFVSLADLLRSTENDQAQRRRDREASSATET